MSNLTVMFSRFYRLCQGMAVIAILSAGSPLYAAAALTLSQGAGGDTLEFSQDQLEALPMATVVTENEFTDGKVTFRGPLVRDVVDHLGLGDADTLRFTAANDYYVDVPTSDIRKYNVILALEADGQPLSRRDKGPIWLMYPISDNSELRDPVYNTRLIWQVVRIEAR